MKRGTIFIEGLVLKHRIDISLTHTNIAILAVVAIFLPYILAGIILISLSLYLVFNKNTRKLIFVHKYSNSLKVFFAFAMIVPMIYRNWLGVIAGFGIILAIILSLFLRSIMTHELYEKVLTLICAFSLTSTSCAICEKIVNSFINNKYSTTRISAEFFHPNYFGTVIGTVIIICAYKVLTEQGPKWFYYMVACMNVISMYLCESMFVWVEVFMGIAVLLIILKKHRLLAVWSFCAALAGFVIFVLNIDVIPRLSDAGVTTGLRLKIWKLAFDQILHEPFLGHGMMSYMFINKIYYLDTIIPHSHSLYLEMILNFGLIGTGILMIYYFNFFKTVIRVCFKEKKTMITSLIIAVTIAALVHGIADITLFWIQTMPLFIIILSGLGAYDKPEKESQIK